MLGIEIIAQIGDFRVLLKLDLSIVESSQNPPHNLMLMFIFLWVH